MATYTVMFVFANLLLLLDPLVVAWILNTIQANGVTRENLPFLGLLLSLFIAIDTGFWLLHGPARVMENKNAFLVRARYKKYLLEGTLDLPSEWHTDHHSGDTIDKIEKGSRALFEFSSDGFMIIEAVVRIIGSYIALALFDLPSSFVIVFAALSAFLMVRAFDRRIIPNYRTLNRAENRISESIFDSISNITTIITLRLERLISKSIVQKMLDPFPLFGRTHKMNELKWFLTSMVNAFMTALVIFIYLYMHVRTGTAVLIGTVYALYGYVNNITRVFFSFTGTYSQIVYQRTAVSNAEELSKEFRKKAEVRQLRLGNSWKMLSIDSLNFSYHTEAGADLHLDDVSMAIRRGERIALVGESGAGKSTLLKIIRDLYHPRQARLAVDGRTIKNGFKALSDEVALIPQDPEIFATTILQNITMGVPHEMAEIRRYTDIAAFTGVAESLPKKFDSSIVEKGVNLSGGEKQRLALARGLLAAKERSILLLDEPTSSVDSRNERLIYENIFGAFKGKTILSTVHRLHLLRLFDTIYVFENGRIAASGSFDDLLKSSAKFQEIWKKYNEKLRYKKGLGAKGAA